MTQSLMEVGQEHPLAGIRAKIERANESLAELNREINAFVAGTADAHSIVGEFDETGVNFIFKVRGDPWVPPRFAVMSGEIIHHLRSCLDHLVVALAVQNGQRPLNNHQFPICRTPEKFEKARGGGNIKGVPPAAANAIERMQPYHSSTPADYFLTALHDMDNTDKHSLLLVVATAAQMGESITVGGANPHTIVGFGNPLPAIISQDGEEIFRIILAAHEPTFKADLEFSTHIAFGKAGSGQAAPVIPILALLRDATATTVQGFMGYF